MERRDLPVQVLFALESLEKAGYEAALVGGCVRDSLMGRAPGDYDITTSALPEETLRVFDGERTIPTGLKHGTVTLLREGVPMEITTFRQDGEYTDMRRPDSVRFTRSLKEDVIRRDFTMNALAWELDRGVIDHVSGVQDIKNGLIRAVGEPARRFTEDALRILRAVRFSSQLGFAIESETERALYALHGNIARIAAERVRVELEKTLLGKAAPEVIRRHREILRPRLGCGALITDEMWEESARRIELLRAGNGGSHLLWSAWLMPAGAGPAAQALLALRADNATVRGVQARIGMAAQPLETKYALRTALGAHDLPAVRDAVLLRYAFEDDMRRAALALLDEIVEQALPCRVADLAVGGADLMQLGVRGKELGAALGRLIDAVRADKVENEREALLDYAVRE